MLEAFYVKQDFHTLLANFNLVRNRIITVTFGHSVNKRVRSHEFFILRTHTHGSISLKDYFLPVIALLVPVTASKDKVVQIDTCRSDISSREFPQMHKTLQVLGRGNIADLKADVICNMLKLKGYHIQLIDSLLNRLGHKGTGFRLGFSERNRIRIIGISIMDGAYVRIIGAESNLTGLLPKLRAEISAVSLTTIIYRDIIDEKFIFLLVNCNKAKRKALVHSSIQIHGINHTRTGMEGLRGEMFSIPGNSDIKLYFPLIERTGCVIIHQVYGFAAG